MLKKKTKKTLRTRLFVMIFTLSLLLPILPLPGVQAASTLNVTSYGANGGDTNDDLTAINSAVTAAVSGDTVLFPSGTYYISGSIIGKSGIKFKGDATATAIIKAGPAFSGHMFNVSNTTGEEIFQLTIDGNNNPNVVTAILSDGGGSHNFHHNIIKNLNATTGFAPFGIMISNSNDNIVTDNNFYEMGVGSIWGAGIRAGWNSNRTKILRNNVDGSGRGAIFANDGCEDITVSNNTAVRSGLAEHGLSIELHTNCNRAIVEDNHVDHWLSVVRSSYDAVRRNFIGTNDGTVQGMGLEVMAAHTITTDNTVDNGQQVGMQQSSGSSYQYWGYNTVQNMVMWGMQLQGEGAEAPQQYQYFYKNTFKNTQRNNPKAAYPGYDGNAIRIHGNSVNMTFDSNTIINNGNKAIEITPSGGTDRLSFINNTITGNAAQSIDQYPASAASLEWSGNTVSGNGTNTQLTSRGFSDTKPTANFTGPTTVSLGSSVTFTNTSTAGTGTIAENLWDLGEGIPVTSNNVTYTYQKAGTYRVTLVVWNTNARASIKEQIVIVSSGPPDTIVPSTPSSLTSPSKTETSVNLTWNASTDNIGVTGYNIYKNGTIAGSTNGATTFTVGGLVGNTAYAFTVKATDASGNLSAASSTLNVTTNPPDTTAPSAPTGLTSPSKTDTTIDLSWTASTDNVTVNGYEVYKNGVLAGTTLGDNGTSFKVTGLTANTAYTFTVKAKDVAGNTSAASSSLNVTTLTVLSITYLSDLTWVSATAGWASVRKDLSSDQNPIRLDGVTYSKGLGTHAASEIIYNLNGAYSRFVSAVGIDDEVTHASASVVFQVFMDGDKVYDSGLMTAASATKTFDLSVANVNQLKLVVTDGGINGADYDHSDWAGAKLTPSTGADATAPTAPTSLTSPSKTSSTVNLSWTASTDNVAVTGYDIYKAGVLAGSTTDATVFTVTGLAASTAYSFTVKARDAAGNVSSASSALSVTTNANSGDTTAPTAPTNLISPANSDTTVNLSWTASTDAVGVTGYNIYKGGVMIGSTTGATTFAVSGLTANTAYSFTVKAKDAAGNISSASSALSITTNGTASWVYCAGENNQCSFTGTKNVRYGANGSYVFGTYTNGVMCSNNALGDPAPGYYKTCDVSDSGGTGDTQAPTVPTSLSSPSKTTSSVNLSWTASTDNVGVAGYDIYQGSSLAGSATGTTFVATGLTANTAYSFTVKAKDAAGNISAASSALSVTTNSGADSTAPSTPTGLASPSKTSTTVNLTWTASTDNVGVTSYEIYKGGVLHGSAIGATSYTVTGLTASTAYSFTVKAKDAANNLSAASTALSVTTNAAGGTGSITRDYWTGITGDTIASIPVGTTPTGTTSLTSLKAPSNFGDNYGTRIRGYIVPSTTGTYTFSVAGDNACELWISTTSSPANKVLVGYIIDYTPEDNWSTYSYQTSGNISMVAGQSYYIEVLQKESSGGDHLSVGWTGPGIGTRVVVPGSNIAPF
ncbi:fibronectin type III domain-containing protein [Paenibacillus psychroresistens]|uniref:fibronectin type III domain-containing protein n=1 Tax=Paenibacillus psychroresistens TaxID=1778678 RepID=UPI001D05261F|nr:NPCBM/NEW2 domain-containing protein [Paenibacillus psychroresistens]